MTTIKKAQTFDDKFLATLREMEAEAKACGLNWTSICKEAGYSRSVIDRWKRRLPKTVAMVSNMQAIIQKHAAAKAAEK